VLSTVGHVTGPGALAHLRLDGLAHAPQTAG
jgi:hypothetical protein